MVEQVEITGVTGGMGPASEATLRKILDALDKSGKGSSEKAKKVREMAEEAVKRGTKSTEKFAKEVDEAADAADRFELSMSSAIGTVFGFGKAIVGFTLGTFSNLISAFADGTGTLTDFVNQVPIVGSLLARVTGLFDETLVVWQGLAMAGAGFNNELTTLRTAAAKSMLSLEEFSSFVSSSTERLSAFGGSVTQGALRMVELNKQLDSEEGLRQHNDGNGSDVCRDQRADRVVFLSRPCWING